MNQILFVSFAAPVATLAMMNKGGISRRHIASTLAMVFATAQANVVFPMAALGLHVGWTMLIAVLAGISLAGLLTNPLDIAGVAILISAGPRVAAVLRPALYGAIIRVIVRRLAYFYV